MEKTHWLQSPNKNYLGHWDLPEGKDLILTIKSAQWEVVKNPVINTSESKRVIRFVEKDVKPLICNQTNAQSIINSTGVKFMEDSGGCKIALYIDTFNDRRTKDKVDCIRVRANAVKTEKPPFPTDKPNVFTNAILEYSQTKSFAKIEARYILNNDIKQQIIDGAAAI